MKTNDVFYKRVVHFNFFLKVFLYTGLMIVINRFELFIVGE